MSSSTKIRADITNHRTIFTFFCISDEEKLFLIRWWWWWCSFFVVLPLNLDKAFCESITAKHLCKFIRERSRSEEVNLRSFENLSDDLVLFLSRPVWERPFVAVVIRVMQRPGSAIDSPLNVGLWLDLVEERGWVWRGFESRTYAFPRSFLRHLPAANTNWDTKIS